MVVNAWDGGTMGAKTALENAGYSAGDVKLVGFDGATDAIVAMDQGWVHVNTAQMLEGMGYHGIRIAAEAANTVATCLHVMTLASLVTPETSADYKALIGMKIALGELDLALGLPAALIPTHCRLIGSRFFCLVNSANFFGIFLLSCVSAFLGISMSDRILTSVIKFFNAGMVCAWRHVVLSLAFGLLPGSNFFASGNLMQIVISGADIGLIAAGMTIVILTAGIDLSVGSILVLVTSVIGYVTGYWAFDPVTAIFMAWPPVWLLACCKEF